MILASKLFPLRHIHLISRSFVDYTKKNDPRRGDKGIYHFQEIWARTKTRVTVIVGMSGGVDSSVAALLLAKGVCAPKATYIYIHLFRLTFFRITTSLLCTCETGTPGMNLVLIVDANGRRTGKMSE